MVHRFNFFSKFAFCAGNRPGAGTGLLAPLLLTLVLLAGSVELTLAQSGGTGGAFTRMGFGPRGMAAGNALSAVPQQGIYAHYNPALAAFGKRQADTGTALMAFGRTLNMVNVGLRLPPSAGLNLGLLHAGVSGIDGRTSSGYHTEMLSVNEFQFFSAFGIRLSGRAALGLSVKLNMARLHAQMDMSRSVGFDLGLLYRLAPRWHVALVVQDVLSSYQWNSSGLYGEQRGRTRTDTFPLRIKTASSLVLPGDRLLVSAEWEVQRQSGEVVRRERPEGVYPPGSVRLYDSDTMNRYLLRTGLVWLAHERLTMRAGWEITDLAYISDTHKLSAGLSVHLPLDALSPSVDYTFVREPLGLASLHMVAIRLHF